MWPVIIRELRSASRGSLTYWLRPLGAGAACAAALLEAGLLTVGTPAQGKDLFAALHLTVFCAIWLLVPLVAADCLSRERREGTLGLLFLTPLKPLHITIAKTLVQSLRALTLWFATLPIVVLPVLMGGVSRDEALVSVLINAASFCWALGAGIYVSSRSTQFHRSVIAALIMAFFFFIIYGILNFVLGVLAFAPGFGFRLDYLEALPIIVFVLGNLRDTWDSLTNQPQFPIWLGTLAGILGFSVLVLAFLAWRAARVLHATWQVSASTGRWAHWRDRLCTPIFRDLYRRWVRWSLNVNPVGWLEHRTWSSRLAKWGWLAVMCAFYGSVLGHGTLLRDEFTHMQVLFAAGLMLSASFTASASFRRERDNGVLALLLVSPLRVKTIVAGRLRALWSQYLPAFCLLFGAWLYLQKPLGASESPFWMIFFASSFLCVPVIGLHCSLWRQTFFGALLWTALYAFVFPLAVSLLLLSPIVFVPGGATPTVLIVTPVGQITIAVTTLALLLRNLSQRSFSAQTS